jgi:hypothetical protein
MHIPHPIDILHGLESQIIHHATSVPGFTPPPANQIVIARVL